MLIADAEGLLFKSFSGKLPQTWLRQYLHRYDDYIECVHKSKQNLRVKAMFKKRHIDNHIEYLQVGTTLRASHKFTSDLIGDTFQGKRTYAETYEAPPKAHAYPEPWHDPK